MRLVSTLAFVSTFASLVSCTYDGQLTKYSNHGYQMGRTQLPGTLSYLLTDPAGWVGTRRYPSAEVVPIATRAHPFTDDQVIQAIRTSADTRNMIVLGRPFPDHPARQGFSAAFHMPAAHDSPGYKTFALLSFERGHGGVPRVYVNGIAAVRNAQGIDSDIAGHHFPALTVEPGSTLTAHELFAHLPR